MKKFVTAMTALALAAPLATRAQGPGDFYLTAGVAQWIVRRSGADELYPSAAMLTLGKSFGSNLAVELAGGTGVASDSTTSGTSRTSAEVKEFGALYVRPYLRVAGERLEYYARFGLFRGRLGGPCGCSRSEAPRDDISYGVGMGFLLSGTSAIVLDLMQYQATNEQSIRAVNVGLRIGF